MVRLADGDRAAFDVLLDELWPVILAFAQRGLGRGPDAEDVAQEVFYKICSRIADFDRGRDGLSWAFGIAAFEIKTHRRKVQRRREVADVSVDTHVDASASQEAQLVDKELSAVLEEALCALSSEDRRALGVDEAPSDVAGATLRKRRQRALDRLKEAWRRIYGDA